MGRRRTDLQAGALHLRVFHGALSVFDSFALSLYFLGNAIQPAAFPDVASLRKITRTTTHKAMSAAFPHDAIDQIGI